MATHRLFISPCSWKSKTCKQINAFFDKIQRQMSYVYDNNIMSDCYVLGAESLKKGQQTRHLRGQSVATEDVDEQVNQLVLERRRLDYNFAYKLVAVYVTHPMMNFGPYEELRRSLEKFEEFLAMTNQMIQNQSA